MKSLQKSSLLLFSLITSVLPVHATSVVCIRTPDSIAIAADSMLAARWGAPIGNRPRECKIIGVGGIYFSMSGFVGDPARNFDAARLVAGALGRLVPPQDPAAVVSEEVIKGLADELRRLKGGSPELYRKLNGQKGPQLKVLLAMFDGPAPRVVQLGFNQAVSPMGEITVTAERESCPGECDPGRINMFILGDRRPIDAYLNSGKADWKSPEMAAKTMVEKVIAAGTPDVGPPVDVLLMGVDGARWVEKKDGCRELTSPAPSPTRGEGWRKTSSPSL